MNPVFADTWFFLALYNPRDEGHQAAWRWSQESSRYLLTTDWIILELADAFCEPQDRQRVTPFIEGLRASPRVTIVPSSKELFEKGWALFRQRTDKAWSLTDCISFVVMKERRMKEALTGDRHFQQAGFKVHF
ncbi:MAG: type II toxin-antitoxin system VapC family toxin [Planctomycetes bacterium]|nr:type II toxin-antitoxin system VapC family toxin [Planctomycetota bacterium]